MRLRLHTMLLRRLITASSSYCTQHATYLAPFSTLYTFKSTDRKYTWSRIHRFTCTNAATAPISVTELESTLGPLDATPTLPPPLPVVLVISGPSGVGKDAVIRKLQEKRPDLYFVVTATSRPMRPGEVEGVDYFFVSKSQFEEWIAASDDLLEWAIVYGEYKGIPRKQVQDALQRGTDVILRIDVQGAATVRRLMPDVVTVFLVAESEAELVQRLLDRKTEPLDKMLVRVQTAKEEMGHTGKFDYVVVNKDAELDKTVGQLEAILQAEKLKVGRRLGSGS
jgi:guanylate kinase